MRMGKRYTQACRIYLGGHAPHVNSAGLPSNVTAVANLGESGTLVRQADEILAVYGKDSALHPLTNGAVDINGNHIEVGYGNTTNGQQPFLEIAQVSQNGATDVSILSLPSSMISSADQLGAVPLDGASPQTLAKGQTPDLLVNPADQSGMMVAKCLCSLIPTAPLLPPAQIMLTILSRKHLTSTASISGLSSQ